MPFALKPWRLHLMILAGWINRRQQAAIEGVKNGFAPVLVPTLSYESAGQGEPIAFIHGGQMDRRMWDRQFSELAKKYRAIRYDVRGYGQSPAAIMPYSDDDDLLALLDHLHVEKEGKRGHFILWCPLFFAVGRGHAPCALVPSAVPFSAPSHRCRRACRG
jgi:hypothetical protein